MQKDHREGKSEWTPQLGGERRRGGGMRIKKLGEHASGLSQGRLGVGGSIDPGCFLHSTTKKVVIDSSGNEFHSLPRSSSWEAGMKSG